jgi:hypothetical protein
VLRGKKPDGAASEPANREQQFARLKTGHKAALNVQFWHDFLKCVSLAGFRSPRMISSQNAVLYSYAFYLLGRHEFKVGEHDLRSIVAQWLFMASITGRYTNSPESRMEFDLARLRDVTTGTHFMQTLQEICSATLTADFWSITLPGDLATSAARSPSMFGFFAALNVLDARALYSNHTVHELMDPATKASKSSLERHHLFPVAFLKKQGITDEREYNQIANYSVVEWGGQRLHF